MPHALTKRQREYLEFIREYIRENESSPRLDETAEHFNVTSPTAHNMLDTLQSKGYLYHARTSAAGYFIRLVERAGSSEIMVEVLIAGRVNKLGELVQFPGMYGHFASVLEGAKPDEIFSLYAIEDIPQASILTHDLIIFDMGKVAQPGDVCIVPIGERLFLAKIGSLTFDESTMTFDMAQEYPIPEELRDKDLTQYRFWYPIAYDEDTEEEILKVVVEQDWAKFNPISKDLIMATALRLSRRLAF